MTDRVEELRSLYETNQAKFLHAKKLAKHISTYTGNIKIRVDLLSNLYNEEFKVYYSFLYTEYVRFNPWLLSMCKNHPVGGKTTGRLNDRHFIYENNFDGIDVKVEIFGILQSDAPIKQ